MSLLNSLLWHASRILAFRHSGQGLVIGPTPFAVLLLISFLLSEWVSSSGHFPWMTLQLFCLTLFLFSVAFYLLSPTLGVAAVLSLTTSLLFCGAEHTIGWTHSAWAYLLLLWPAVAFAWFAALQTYREAIKK